MRILVTGGTGFIGRALIPQLLNRPETLQAQPAETARVEPAETARAELAEATRAELAEATRAELAEATRAELAEATRAELAEAAVTLLLLETFSGQPLPSPLNHLRPLFDVVYADLRHFNLTVRAVRQAQPDAVIHLAAAGALDPFLGVETAVRHNLIGTTNLLRACFEKNTGVQQCIVARTPGERSSMNVYAASKAAAWEFCRLYARTQGWPIHGAMIFQAYGPGQPQQAFVPAAIQAAMAGEDFPMTEGSQVRDWIYVADVAAGLTAMLARPLAPGTTVELGTGTGTSLAEAARLIYQTVNRGGRPLVGALPNRPGEDAAQIADAAGTQDLIGWQTAVSLAEGIGKLVNG